MPFTTGPEPTGKPRQVPAELIVVYEADNRVSRAVYCSEGMLEVEGSLVEQARVSSHSDLPTVSSDKKRNTLAVK